MFSPRTAGPRELCLRPDYHSGVAATIWPTPDWQGSGLATRARSSATAQRSRPNSAGRHRILRPPRNPAADCRDADARLEETATTGSRRPETASASVAAVPPRCARSTWHRLERPPDQGLNHKNALAHDLDRVHSASSIERSEYQALMARSPATTQAAACAGHHLLSIAAAPSPPRRNAGRRDRESF